MSLEQTIGLFILFGVIVTFLLDYLIKFKSKQIFKPKPIGYLVLFQYKLKDLPTILTKIDIVPELKDVEILISYYRQSLPSNLEKIISIEVLAISEIIKNTSFYINILNDHF